MIRYLLGPESVLALLVASIYWFCSRYPSGQGRDIIVLERALMLLPFVVVPLVFATFAVPGSKNWWWMARAVVACFVALTWCGTRIIEGFGTGPRGRTSDSCWS